MNIVQASPESISKNIFEKYYQLIESRRIEFNDLTSLEKSYDSLERFVMAIERSIQDISSNESISKNDKTLINNVVSDTLTNWLPVVICADEEINYLYALSYNFFVLLSILEMLSEIPIIIAVRHVYKLGANIESLTSKLFDTKRIKDLSTHIQATITLKATPDTFQDLFKYITLKKQFSTINDIIQTLLEDDNSKFIMKDSVLYSYAASLLDRFESDYFKIPQFDIILEEGINEIRSLSRKTDFHEKIERLFEFDDNLENLIWSINVYIEDETYNAAEIGFLIWAISKSLESIDDVEVELIEWGEGSKWFNLKVRIKSLASKVDVLEVLKTVRQGLEAHYFHKPIGEIKKAESEAVKIKAEANKIEKETENLPTPEEARITKIIDIQQNLLALQEKEIDLEVKKADIRLKNLQYLKGLSELMKEGIIQNDSNLKIMINSILFVEKKDNKLTQLGSIELLDVKEQTENKPDDES